MWSGAKESDVCSQLTGVSAEHWSLHSDWCTDLIRRKTYMFMFSMLLFGAIYGTVLCSAGFCVRVTLVDPICRAFLRGRIAKDR